MSQTTAISVRVDADLKKEADELYKKLGISLSTAINIFLHKSVSERGIPFDVNVANEEYLAKIKRSAEQIKRGEYTRWEDVKKELGI
jgi:DNA-damage-inducible protein J